MAQSGGGVAGKPTLLPNLDVESTRAHNLTVLQRFDSSVEEILFTAAHVTLYDFNIDLNQWSRKDVEGSLFVVKRNAQPRFQFIVMNRRNAANLVENILGDFEYDLKAPYLLYRNASQEVTGIWFYNSSECEAVSSLFNRIIGAFSKVPAKPEGSLNKRESDGSEVVRGTTVESPQKPPATSTTTIAAPRDYTGTHSIANIQQQQQQLHPTSGSPPSQIQSVESTCVTTPQTPPPLTTSTSAVSSSPLESITNANGNHSADLLKPSLFSPSMVAPNQSSSIPVASTFEPTFTLHHPTATTSLHPFPPPVSALGNPSSNYGSIITRDKVREALSRLAQNDQFVDMVYGEILNAQNP